MCLGGALSPLAIRAPFAGYCPVGNTPAVVALLALPIRATGAAMCSGLRPLRAYATLKPAMGRAVLHAVRMSVLISASGVEMGAILNFLTRKLRILGEMNAGSEGPMRMFSMPR